MKKKPPFPAMKAIPTVSSEMYHTPFMYSGSPTSAPRFQYSNPTAWLAKCSRPLTAAPPSSNTALRIPAPGDLRIVATATPPG